MTTFCRKITGVERPRNIFISASTNIVAIVSTSPLATDTPPFSMAPSEPSSGSSRRTASMMPCSVTALAYLWA